jgi:endonuclease/exonuclease/phosphatase family metal-dependent hydrolase
VYAGLAVVRPHLLAVLLAGACANNAAAETDAATGTDTSTATSPSTGASTGGAADASSSSGAVDTGDSDATGTGAEVVPFSGSLRVMTFNVLCSFCDPTFPPWETRVPWIGDTLSRHDPDLVGLQEIVTADELTQILEAAPGYLPVYFEGAGGAYPDATVLFRASRFEPVQTGFYWLSPTPDDPMSTGFADGLQFPRLVTWTVLRQLDDGAQLYFATTHFDNNAPSQELSAPLVLERIAPFDGLPQVMLGDFNSRPDSEAYAILTGAGAFADSFHLAEAWSIETNAARRPAYDTSERIDHVLLRGTPWSVPSWTVDTWTYGAEASYVSDHFAIAAEVSTP